MIALQETKLKTNETILGIRKYSKYTKNYTDGEIACGGVSLLVRDDLIQAEIELNTPLQAVAARVTLYGKAISAVSLYLPPQHHVTRQQLTALINQIPHPVLLLGDLNAHNPIWGGQSRNPKGRLVEQLTLEHDLIIFNDGRPTRVSPASNTKSSIDLCIGHQQLGLDYRWDVLDDTHGSDHYPTVLIHTVHKNRGEPRPRRWVMRKADQQKFKMLCEERLSEQILDNNNPMSVFTKTVYDIAVETIPKSPAHPKKIPVPWFDEECRLSILEKKRLNQRHVRHSTMESKIARNRQINICKLVACYGRNGGIRGGDMCLPSIRIQPPGKCGRWLERYRAEAYHRHSNH